MIFDSDRERAIGFQRPVVFLGREMLEQRLAVEL